MASRLPVVIIGSDHAGFQLKEAIRIHLTEKGHQVMDMGSFNENRTDYPCIADAVSRQVLAQPGTVGILTCGSGIGVSIAANRLPGIRAALVHDTYNAGLSRQHNDANVLCLGGRLIAPALAFDIVEAWLNTPFDGGRHQTRIELIDQLSQSHQHLSSQGDLSESCSI